MNWRALIPFLIWWPEVNRHSLRSDVIAGLIGAVVVVPQGVAFATIAGMPPEYGLYAAVFPAAIAALFGSSRLMICGPTTPASIVLFSTLATMAEPGSAAYVQLALTLTLMVGLIQFAMGLARLGYLVNFISHSVVVGFTAGAAFLIAGSQLKSFLGLYMPTGAHFFAILTHTYENITYINIPTTLIGVATLATGMLSRRYIPKIPYMIVAMLVGSLLALPMNQYTDAHIPLIGVVPAAFPPLSSPDFSFSTWTQLAPAALAVTLFALTEAVSIARSLAARRGQQVDGSQEFIGQGLSNIAGAFLSGYISTGSFNRSGLNFEAGAVTPLASIIAAGALILVLLLVAPLLAYMPKSAMAAVLFLVAYGIIDKHDIRTILKSSPSDSWVLVITFLATLLLKLDFAILLGVLLSLLIYLNKASRPAVRTWVPDPRLPKRRLSSDLSLPQCPQLKLVRIDGALFFGAANYVSEHLREYLRIDPGQKHLLLLARPIGFLDVVGAELLAREKRQRKAIGGDLYLHQLPDRAHEILFRGGYLEQIGESNFFDSKNDAIRSIVTRLDKSICGHCDQRIFNECKDRPGAGGNPGKS